MPGGAGELPLWSLLLPLGFHLRHLLYRLKQPRPPGDAVGLQGGGDRQTDGLLGAAQVRYHEIIAIQEINKEYQQQKTNQRSPMDGPAKKHPQYRGEARGVI